MLLHRLGLEEQASRAFFWPPRTALPAPECAGKPSASLAAISVHFAAPNKKTPELLLPMVGAGRSRPFPPHVTASERLPFMERPGRAFSFCAVAVDSGLGAVRVEEDVGIHGHEKAHRYGRLRATSSCPLGSPAGCSISAVAQLEKILFQHSAYSALGIIFNALMIANY